WQLAWPDRTRFPGHPVPILGKLMGWDGGYMPSDFYNTVLSMHATVMIFFVLIPLLVGTFGNYLIPLKIGAGDMAFPFLNGLAFWSAFPAGTIMLVGFFVTGGGAAAGWTSYPPLSGLTANSTTPLTYAANLLRAENSTWPMAPVVINFFTFSMAFAYICCYYVKLGNKFLNGGVSVLLSIIAG